MKTILLLLATVCTGLTGCCVVPKNNAEGAASGRIESAVISGIYENPIRLDRGRYEGEPFVPGGASRPTVTLLPEPRVLVDVDGDGDREWLAVLAESSGGSGTFRYLTVLKRGRDGFRSRATVLLGDRVRVTQLSVQGAIVRIDLLDAGKDDPPCCPTNPRARRWMWLQNELQPVSRYAGSLVYGHETREFVTCDGRRHWATDATDGDLRQTYEASIVAPYQPLFAEVEAVRAPAPDGAFAAPYAEQLLMTRLLRLETEGPGCALDIGEAQYRASGVEPFWHVDVGTDVLRYSRLDQAPRLFTISARDAAASSQTWRGSDDGGSLALSLTEERCVNPMSGSVFAFIAELSLAGETRYGCALAPLPREAD